FDAEAGISMLDWLLQKLKMGRLNATTEIDATHKVKISYQNIREDKLSLLELDSFISGSDPIQGRFNTFREKREDGELYVINNVVKSDPVSVGVEALAGAQVDIEENIKGVVDARVDVSRSKNNALTLPHTEADTYLVVAIKAQPSIYDHKEWWQF